MKTIFPLSAFIAGIVLLTGCTHELQPVEPHPSDDKQLSLVAPNGEMIAPSLQALQAETADMVISQFGNAFPFEITDIEYATPGDGYLAVISYRLANGRTSNFAKSNSTEAITHSPVDQLYWDIDLDMDMNHWLYCDEDGTLSVPNKE